MRQCFRACLSVFVGILFVTLNLHGQGPIARTGAASQPPPQNPGAISQGPGGEAVVTGNGIEYHNGLVISSPTAYFIWYGNWDGDTGLEILPQFISDLSVTSYANINTTYSDNFGNTVSNLVLMHNQAFDFYSQGSSLGVGSVATIVNNALTSSSLPTDTNGIYFVLTSPDVTESSDLGTFCVQYCGYHKHATLNGVDIKFAFVGNPATQCLNFQGCAPTNQSVSPNSNPGVDVVANVITHELNESATDPDYDGWFHINLSGEVGDLCNRNFGNNTFNLPNGSVANFSVAGRNYLIQQNWLNANGGLCAMSFTPPPTGQPSVQLVDNTRGGTNYQVGDNFTVLVQGAPNQQVTVTQTTNGVTGAPFVFGQTDNSGNFSVSGTWAPGDAANYVQVWAVGGASANPTLRFFVRPTVQLFDLMRGGTDYHSGDTFNLVVTGPPNQSITVISSKNGGAASPVPFGQTDANGNFSFSGTWSDSDIGSYAQLWTVGTLQATPTLPIIVKP